MTGIRQTRLAWRQWLGLCLALLLALAPPFNLAGFDLTVGGHAETGAHPGHGHESQLDSSLAHHSSGNACLQCLVMGGMSLVGAAALPTFAPALHAIGTVQIPAVPAWDSRAGKVPVCRGPPAFA